MKIKNLLLPAFLLFMISCTKSKSNNVSPQDGYLTTSAGSTWNYHETDSTGPAPVNKDYTLTSTSRDSLINNKNYHVYGNSGGSNQYFYFSGNDYYQFDSLPAGFGLTVFERLYLMDTAPVGFTWTQTLTVNLSGTPVPFTLTYNIAEKGISRNVNGTTYSDVIHVTTSLHSSLIPTAALTTDINSYYAEKYGLIENTSIISLNYMTFIQNINTETKLVSATLL